MNLRISTIPALAAIALAVAGCKSLPETTSGTELRQGDVGITVTGHELAYIDLQSDTGAVVSSQEPVLLIRLSVTNHGTAPSRYDMRDAATSGQQALTPLLFVDPGPDREWRTQSNNVPQFVLPHTYLGDPVTEMISIAPGTTIEDVLLFHPPPAGTSGLVLSLPPTAFGGGQVELPGIVRIAYSETEPSRPPIANMGEEVPGDGFSFRLDSAHIDYYPNVARTGFTANPVLGLRYTIRNTGGEPLRYAPPHRDSIGEAAPSLTDGQQPISRMGLRDQPVEGQITEPQVVQPGATLSDLLLFDRPAQSTTQLTLYFPGHVVGRTGLLRVRFPYAWADPRLPEELTNPPRRQPAQPEVPEGSAPPVEP